MTTTFSLVPNEAGRLVAHHPECSIVKIAREAGIPIMTLVDTEKPLGSDVLQHHCLSTHETERRR